MKKIELANDPDLAASRVAMMRAAKQARKVANRTNTNLVVLRHGETVRVKPVGEVISE